MGTALCVSLSEQITGMNQETIHAMRQVNLNMLLVGSLLAAGCRRLSEYKTIRPAQLLQLCRICLGPVYVGG